MRFWIRGWVKSDGSFRWDGRLQHLLDGGEYCLKSGIVFSLHLLNFLAQLFVRSQQTSQLHKRAHDGDIDVHGARAAQNAREHGYTLFGECVGSRAARSTPT